MNVNYDVLTQAFEVLLKGMVGIFFVLFIIYLVIKLLNYAFPESVVVHRKIDRATGKVIETDEK